MAPARKWFVVGAVAVTAVALTPFVSFAGTSGSARTPAPDRTVAEEFDLAPGMVEAMRRDLKMTDRQIARSLATSAGAAVVQKRLKSQLGRKYAGAWIPEGGDRLTVAVTDEAQAAKVREEGADPVIVDRSQADLDKAMAALDKNAKKARDLHSWYVDVQSNSVVVVAEPGAEAAARKFAKDSGAGEVTVKAEAVRLTPIADIRGGDQFTTDTGAGCSVGFSVTKGGEHGFVSAGHCGNAGQGVRGVNGGTGTIAQSVWGGNDMSYIRANGDWTARPWVNNYGGGVVEVRGSSEAAAGADICRSGKTTGWRCGKIVNRGVTATYPDGRTVTNLIETSACAGPGDSGGAAISGNQAQGVSSAVNGGCDNGGHTWVQPVNTILSSYGLTLVTAGNSGGGGSAPAGNGERVISNWNNKCLDVPNGNFSDGVRVQMWPCNGADAQRWISDGGRLRTAAGNKCLDISGGSTQKDTPIQIATCSGNPAQQWVLSGAGDLVNPQANRCLDIKSWNNGDGAQLIIYDCLGGANQKWRRG